MSSLPLCTQELEERVVELEARLEEAGFSPIIEWPGPVYHAALELLGYGAVNRKSRTRKGLDRKISHALRVWDNKYGPMNPAQAEFAAECLVSCFPPDADIALVYWKLDAIVHAEETHAGFLTRAGV